MVFAMVGLWAFRVARPAHLPLVLVVATIWGGMAFWNSPVIQARMHVLAGSVAGQALALKTSGTYLGISMGSHDRRCCPIRVRGSCTFAHRRGVRAQSAQPARSRKPSEPGRVGGSKRTG